MADSRPWRYLYNRKAWHKLRAAQLRDEPTCRLCRELGRVTAATVVDHITPHRGDEVLFFDAGNLASMCKHCHDSHKQRQEKSGSLPGCGTDGWPLDHNHHWQKG